MDKGSLTKFGVLENHTYNKNHPSCVPKDKMPDDKLTIPYPTTFNKVAKTKTEMPLSYCTMFPLGYNLRPHMQQPVLE